MYKKVPKGLALILYITIFLTVLSYMVQISQAQSKTDLENTMLNIHNQERAAVGVQPLTWSNSLATDSQSWANHLTTLGLVCDDQRCDATPHGAKNENIASGVAGLNSPVELAQLWADEKSKYDDGQRSGPGIGHYTAMVWQNTHEVGCGFSSAGGMDFLVCRYSPPGNIPGQTPFG